MQNSSKEMRKFVAGLLYCAMLKIYPKEKEKIVDYWTSMSYSNDNFSVLGNFILILLKNMYEMKKYASNNL